MSTNYKNKIYGSVFGSFLGDAIGFLFEGHNQSFIKDYIPLIKNYEIINYNRGYNKKLNGPIHKNEKSEWKMNFGQITDDSQLTLLVIENICKNNGKFNLEEFGHQIKDLFENKKIVGYGKTTEKFTDNLSRNINYKYCGVNSTSNGSVMRSDIFGLIYFNMNDNELFEIVKEQSLLTHLNYKSLASSLCVSFTIKYIMNNKNIEDDMLLYNLYTKIKNINIDVANAILNMKNILNYNEKDAFKMIKEYETIKWSNESLSSCSLTTLLWSLYSFLKNKENFMNCLICCLSVGGDVDTIAKISCSFSGCYLGINKIPKKYLYYLHDKKRYNYNNIIILLDYLINIIKKI